MNEQWGGFKENLQLPKYWFEKSGHFFSCGYIGREGEGEEQRRLREVEN